MVEEQAIQYLLCESMFVIESRDGGTWLSEPFEVHGVLLNECKSNEQLVFLDRNFINFILVGISVMSK